MGWQSPILLTHPPPQPRSPHSHQKPLTAALGLVALVFIHAELKCSSNGCPRLGKGHRDSKDLPPRSFWLHQTSPLPWAASPWDLVGTQGLGTQASNSSGQPRGLGGVMRPRKGGAPSASLPAHPRIPEQQKRQEKRETCPAQVLQARWLCPAPHPEWAEHLCGFGTTPVPSRRQHGPPWDRRAVPAGLHCALRTKRACGTPRQPEIIAASTGRRQEPCCAPIPVCHAGQDPSQGVL